MESAEVLALVGGHVGEEILLRNEYLAAENELLKSKLQGPLRFTNKERVRLAKIGKRLGRKALKDIGPIVKPESFSPPGSPSHPPLSGSKVNALIPRGTQLLRVPCRRSNWSSSSSAATVSWTSGSV